MSRVASTRYCRLAIDEFIGGRKVDFGIFIRLKDDRYVKVDHNGVGVSADRLRAYKSRGLQFLYIQQEDFNRYVGFDIDYASLSEHTDAGGQESKVKLLAKAAEILNGKIRHDGLDEATYLATAAFVEASFGAIADDKTALGLLDHLSRHSDHVFTHSLGVSVFAVLIGQKLKWSIPTNKFKLAIAGLFHDIGERELSQHMLSRPKLEWSEDEWKAYETHPDLGSEILAEIRSIPADVLQMVKQHHENCAAQGFPARLSKTKIHPMAKILGLADAFSHKVLPSPDSAGIPPIDAVFELIEKSAEFFDKDHIAALAQIFKAPQT